MIIHLNTTPIQHSRAFYDTPKIVEDVQNYTSLGKTKKECESKQLIYY